jgi:hypothetical protein
MSKIRYSGGSHYGYEASLGGIRVNVKRDGAFWAASYHGIPLLHNPIEKADEGRISISCSCPTIAVGNGFEKRKDAAEAALDVKRKEGANWNRAYSQAKEADPQAPGSVLIKRAREIYKALAA